LRLRAARNARAVSGGDSAASARLLRARTLQPIHPPEAAPLPDLSARRECVPSHGGLCRCVRQCYGNFPIQTRGAGTRTIDHLAARRAARGLSRPAGRLFSCAQLGAAVGRRCRSVSKPTDSAVHRLPEAPASRAAGGSSLREVVHEQTTAHAGDAARLDHLERHEPPVVAHDAVASLVCGTAVRTACLMLHNVNRSSVAGAAPKSLPDSEQRNRGPRPLQREVMRQPTARASILMA
jgi:hypothetical protein